jgi:hypothetical protein
MADQFDLEQGIMGCWHVTDDLDILLEELMENQHFTKDQASNFVLGLSTIYQAKFEKLFRDFEGFIKTYYEQRNELKRVQAELLDAELAAMDEANELLADASLSSKSLEELFLEEEEKSYELAMGSEDHLFTHPSFMEDENGYYIFPK